MSPELLDCLLRNLKLLLIIGVILKKVLLAIQKDLGVYLELVTHALSKFLIHLVLKVTRIEDHLSIFLA
jgi:hypothetical protein